MLKKNLESVKDPPELIAQSEIQVDSIIILDFAKIGMTLVTVPLAIVVFIFMTGQITKLVGSSKEIFKEHKKKDGEELVTHNLLLNKIFKKHSKL